MLLALILAGCGGGQGGRAPYDGYDPNAAVSPGQFYRPPGPASDPWGPYIREASSRFDVPDSWVRAVMRQESGGQQQAVSPVGAIGLMQLMPATYAGLRDQYGLGPDPYNPHDNLLAGTAYLRQMYDRFGAPAFLAAYNAGPERVSSYLAGGDPLPAETVNYLAALAPQLGSNTRLTGPLAVYAGDEPVARTPTPRSFAAGCDADAAYDPDHPCAELEQAAAAPARPVAAYRPAIQTLDTPHFNPPSSRVAASWAIQVGAFADPDLARGIATRARTEAGGLLDLATLSVPTTTPFGGRVLYRARLIGLSANSASEACRALNARQFPCIVVRPGL